MKKIIQNKLFLGILLLTIVFTNKVKAQCGVDSVEIIISITTDNYPGQTYWELVDQNGGGWYISAGSLTSPNTTYSWNICVPDTNCYSFTMFDSWGDGICCAWGNGSYSISYNGVTSGSGGSFGYYETTCGVGFCQSMTEIEISITTDDYPSETSWQLIDQNGGGWYINPGDLTLTNTTYMWTICVPTANCYSFIISDTYGDGICCSWGSGSYTVYYGGTSVASGGSFTYDEETCNIGTCTGTCSIIIPPNASNEGESCGSDANGGCNGIDWNISNITITNVHDDWDWGHLWSGLFGGEQDPDLFVALFENNNYITNTGYYLDSWYPNSFNLSPPWELDTNNTYSLEVWDSDGFLFFADDYIGSHILSTPFTTGTIYATTSGSGTSGADINYTLNPPTYNFTPLANGQTMHGTTWAENGTRDTDWYELILQDTAVLTLDAIAEFNFQIALIDPNGGCNNYNILQISSANPCDTISFTDTLNPGTYWVVAMPNSFSCQDCNSDNDYLFNVNWINVVPPCAISTSFTTNLVSCTNANSGAIDVSIIGGTAPFVYSWSNGATTEDLSSLAAGNYTLNITDNYGCPTSVSVVLAAPETPMISVNTQNIQCSGEDDGAIDITINGGLPTYVYNWSNGATTEDLNNLSIGTYTVTVTDSLGCSNSTSSTISDNTTPINLSFVVTDESTPGANDGAIDLTVSGGVSPYMYMWSIGIFTEDLSNLSAGIYYIAVLDSNGCLLTDSAIVSTNTTTIDVGIIDIISPTSGCLLDSNETLTVAIKNFLVTPASNFDIVFEFAGVTYTETVTATLTTYQVLNYTFTPTIDLSVAGIYPITTYISSVNDNNNTNDTLLKDIHNYDHDFYSADYSMSFEPFEDVTGWYMEDVNMDNVSWNISPGIGVNYSNGAFYNYNFDGVTPADDWMLSQCFVLDANVNYEISFKHRVASLVFPENMTVMIGAGQSGAGQSDTLISMQNMTNTSYDSTAITFSVLADGIYYIGWHAESNPNMWRIDLDEINLGVSANTVILGCTDSTASNYNPLATIDDGSCTPCVWGCMDTTSLNYDSNATCGDSSCIPIIYGCTDSSALNYYVAATVDDSTCIYLTTGCTDTAAINFNPLAMIDDGSCVYCIYGCIDSLAINYNINATCSDSSCVYCVYGCTDSTASNYNQLATCDDGSCTYTTSCANPVPTGLNFTDLTDDRVRINWNDMNTNSCLVEQLRIHYREVGTTTWSQRNAVGSGLCNFGLTTTSKVIFNLTPSTTYEYKMKAWYCNTVGASAWTSLYIFTTADTCSNIINFSVSTPLTTRATFTWDTTAAYSFVRLKLRIDTTNALWTTAGGFGVLFPALTKDKNGLIPGTSYRASARTWCSPNGGTYRSTSWTSPIFWVQPTTIRLESETTSIINLEVFPNPSRDVFNISFDLEKKQDLEIRIINVIGELIYWEEKEKFSGAYTKQINLDKYPKAVYFLEIETEKGIVNKKIIIN
ncbi:MAG: T9SS type A sorting domain-containing protein [Flavobacteriales bacterium]|nr:T9SS type A sorting domain-containing protein [Flavobacteriales bacterium]